MTLASTAVSLRCPHCEVLYDSGTVHRCGEEDQGAVAVNFQQQPGDELIGAILGERYEILDRLSAGGMGVVYKAKHILLDSEVAVKILLKPQDPDAQFRFLQEAQLASKIQHPNTVYISDFGLLPDGRSYLVMEFLRGATLSEIISRGPTAPLRVCQIGVQIARGLAAVHDKGIIHRDLKPDNIFLITQDGKQDFVKIVDFGIATNTTKQTLNVKLDGMDPDSSMALRAVQKRHTLPGTVLGTPHYMSPEQAMGEEVDARADQYALGCILYELLTGTPPFDDDNAAALMFKHAYRPPQPMKERQKGLSHPESLDKLVMRTLAKKREQRFASMRELEQALTTELELLGGKLDPGRRPSTSNLAPLPLSPEPLHNVSPAPLHINRMLWLGVAGLVLALSISGGVIFHLLRRNPTTAAADGDRDRPDTKLLLSLRAAAIDQLKRDLTSPDLELRQGAATALGTTYDASVPPLFAALLDDKEPAMRAKAAELLGQLGQQSVVPRLAKLLESASSQPVVAVAAAEALDQLGDARGQKALRQALGGKNDPAKLRAALYLTGRGDKEAQKMLSVAVQRGRVPEEGAITILARLCQAGDQGARDNLLTRLGSVENREVQLNLASTLGRIGEARGRDFLREQAKRPGPIQLRAASLLASIDEPVDAELFRAVLNNKSAAQPARLMSLFGLGYVGAASDLPRLQPVLNDGSEPKVRQAAAVAMIRISDADPALSAAQSLGWAQEAASDPNWLMRDQAVATLGDLESGGVAALYRLLRKHDADPVLRQKAALALGHRKDPESLRVLRESLDDADPGVQLAARAALLDRGDEKQREPLKAELKSSDEAVRQKVVESVNRDRELLASALTDKAPKVRWLAARKLAAQGDVRAVPVLREAMKEDPGGPDGLKAVAALRRLGEIKEAGPSSGTLAALLSSDPEVRSAALEAVSAQGLETAQPALEKATRDPDRRVRLKVAELISGFVQGSKSATPHPTAVSILRKLSRDPDLSVRVRAQALLSRLKPEKSEAAPEAQKPTSENGSGSETPGDTATFGKEAAQRDEKEGEKGDEKPEAPSESKLAEKTTSLSKGAGHEELVTLLRAGSEPFKHKDYRKAQKALERLSSQCERLGQKVCAPIAFELSYYLGRSYEAQGQFAEAMNEFQRLENLHGGGSAERAYLQDVVKRLGQKLGRVEVQRQKKGRCQTMIMWVTPGEQQIRISATDKRTVRVGANQKTSVGACK